MRCLNARPEDNLDPVKLKNAEQESPVDIWQIKDGTALKEAWMRKERASEGITSDLCAVCGLALETW